MRLDHIGGRRAFLVRPLYQGTKRQKKEGRSAYKGLEGNTLRVARNSIQNLTARDITKT